MKYIIIIITAFILFLYLRDIDYALLYDQLYNLGWLKASGLLLISFLSYALGTIAWMLCLNQVFNLKFFTRFFITRQIGESLSLVNPTGIVAGEALKVYLLGRKGYSKYDVSQSVLISRFLLWFSYVSLLLFVLLFVTIDLAQSSLVYAAICIATIIVASLLLMILFHKQLWGYIIVNKLSVLTQSEYLKSQLSKIREYNIQLHSFWITKKTHILISIVLFVLHYLVGATEYTYILYVLDSPIDFSTSIFLEIGTSFLKSILSFIPGQVGVEEYGNKYFLSLVGVQDDSLWITVSVLRRIRQLWWLLFGLIAYVLFANKQANHINNIQLTTHGSTIH